MAQLLIQVNWGNAKCVVTNAMGLLKGDIEKI